MKTLKTFFTVILPFLIITSSCKKEKDDNSDQTTMQISGNVVLPNATAIDENALQVLSVNDESGVANGKYELEIFTAPFSTQLLLNNNNEVVMMGFTYPGQANYDISARSTALAMIMNTPAVLFIDSSGKQRMIANVLSSPELNNMIGSIESSVRANSNLFDTSNTTLMQNMGALFTSASFKTGTIQSTAPVNVYSSGRNFIFSNNAKAHSSVIGIYKDNQRIEKIVIDGLKFVPTSVNEVVAGYGGISDPPVEKSFTLSGDGQFEIKIRTGSPGQGDGRTEQTEAFYENLLKFSVDMLFTFLPFSPTPNCKAVIRLNIANTVKSITEVPYTQPVGAGAISSLLYLAVSTVFSQVETITECAKLPNTAPAWFAFIGKWLGFANKATAIIGNSANMTIFAYQWGESNPVIDTCFKIAGNNFMKCNSCPASVNDIDGNAYNVVSIGNQCWMKENLKVSNAIPNVSDSAQWGNLTTPAWCYYKNISSYNTIYGKLYNWHAAKNGNLCPQGWHIPTNAEWQQLFNFLDGITVAGASMKATSQWDLPNTGATNNSGFSALPGGARGIVSDNIPAGYYGEFWSSTESSSIEAWLYELTYDSPSVTIWSDSKKLGLSCRCIKD